MRWSPKLQDFNMKTEREILFAGLVIEILSCLPIIILYMKVGVVLVLFVCVFFFLSVVQFAIFNCDCNYNNIYVGIW